MSLDLPVLIVGGSLVGMAAALALDAYLTGDLVETTSDLSCRPGTTAIKPLGRARYGVPDPGSDRWLITPASVLEAIDEIPEIQRTPRFAGVSQIRDPHAIGHPKYQTRWFSEGACLRSRIEFVVGSSTSDDRRKSICSQILAQVVKANTTLDRAIREGVAVLEVDTCDDIEEGDLIAQAHSGGVWSDA